MRTFAIAFLTALALAGAASAQTPSPNPVPTAASAPSAVVHIKNYAYSPATVTVQVGQSVAWVQDDDTAHTVTAIDASFDSGNMDKNGGFTHTFVKAGSYPYYCTYHRYMKGTVIVK